MAEFSGVLYDGISISDVLMIQLRTHLQRNHLNFVGPVKRGPRLYGAFSFKMIFLFVHIAKTAGSSVNRFFQQQFGETACLVHQESNPALQQPSQLSNLLEGVHFVSGHIPYRALTARLAEYPLHTITVLRDPRSHVVSHLAWIRHLKDPGHESRFAAHPPFIQVLAEKLAAVELGDAAALAALVKGLSVEERGLLDNPQVRYLTHYPNVPAVMREQDTKSALDTLREIDTFGFVEESQELFNSLAKVVGSDQSTAEVPHENAHGNRYGLDPSDEAQMQALSPLIKHDLSLYVQARALYQARQKGESGGIYRRRNTRGHLGKPNARQRVPGWAFDNQSKEPVWLDIYINDEWNSTLEASRPRKGLQEKFGRDCGFRIDLASVSAVPGDRIAVFFHDTFIELSGSPIKVPYDMETEPSG